MPVKAVSTSQPSTAKKHKSKFNSVQVTGYAALGLGVASGVLAKNKKIKLHSYLAYAAGVLSLAHIGIIEYFHHKYRKNKK